MSHKEQRQFCRFVRSRLPKFFKKVNVIDVGSLDINGHNRYLFSRSHYTGIDIVEGKNVDHVGKAKDLLPGMNEPDIIVSTEMLEHDRTWRESLLVMYNRLKQGGLLLITCAGDGRAEHGTTEFHAWTSPGTNDYYKNISNEMFGSVLKPDMFKEYYLVQDPRSCDLQFYGVKK